MEKTFTEIEDIKLILKKYRNNKLIAGVAMFVALLLSCFLICFTISTIGNEDITTNVMLYICILAFISLSIWGTLSMLITAIKSENEINNKILDMQKNLYTENQMIEIIKKKKEK